MRYSVNVGTFNKPQKHPLIHADLDFIRENSRGFADKIKTTLKCLPTGLFTFQFFNHFGENKISSTGAVI